MRWRSILFGFEGRLRRRDWWLWSIAVGVVQVLTTEIANLLLFGPTHSLLGGTGQAAAQRATDAGPQLILWVSALVFLWPWLALAVKRAHDRNGWGAAAAVCLLISIFRMPPSFYENTEARLDEGLLAWGPIMVTASALIAAQLFLLVTLGFLDGTKGPNRFGPSPKGAGGPADKAAEVFS
ncbi:DUF805 domain-containing protein [Brevundimonas sp. UBA7664]|uniref:DUF805 domain-containing protein n=1 Tax=Brevundimonas sp. UBA7664 TaxID=1946141 RepID=UPI0025C307A1|nr:DUF805 domain-containing protein [Brevundimonas sp. UBA7664]